MRPSAQRHEPRIASGHDALVHRVVELTSQCGRFSYRRPSAPPRPKTLVATLQASVTDLTSRRRASDVQGVEKGACSDRLCGDDRTRISYRSDVQRNDVPCDQAHEGDTVEPPTVMA